VKIVNLILKFLLFIVKEILSFFIKLFLLLFVIVSIVGILSTKKIVRETTIAKNSWVEVDLNRKIYEKKTNLPSFFGERDLSFFTLLESLKAIGDDANVTGVIMRLDGMSLSYGQIEEVSALIREMKLKGKTVYAWTTGLNNGRYWLASTADRIVMPPAAGASVNLGGYYTEIGYFKGLLDKLGIAVQVIHVGEYKSYGETFIRDRMSPEYRRNLTEIYDKILSAFLRDIAVARKQNRSTLEALLLKGELMASSPAKLKALGLIDETQYYSDLTAPMGDRLVNINKYIFANNIGSRNPKKNKIAVITAEGDIINTRSKSRGYIYPAGLIADLEKARKNADIKGIVLRINSPGGSALASDIIAAKIREVRAQKPVYISIGGMAASGGYYIASAGSKIYASAGSVTGSIGVVSLIPNLSKLLNEKGAVAVETIKKGDYTDLYSVGTPFTAERMQKLQASAEAVYEDFLRAVAAGRNRNVEDIEKIAGGKVWLGVDGVKNGLVDEIGGLGECIAGLARDYDVREYSVVEITTIPGIDSFLEDYVPMSRLFRLVESADLTKEYYFTPLPYFPYDIR